MTARPVSCCASTPVSGGARRQADREGAAPPRRYRFQYRRHRPQLRHQHRRAVQRRRRSPGCRVWRKATATAAAGVATRRFNANLDSRNFYVPGVITLIVVVITLMLSSMAVVREKGDRHHRADHGHSHRPGGFILGKTLPFALIAYLDVALITAISVFWFEVPIRGSMALLARDHHSLPDEHDRYRSADLDGEAGRSSRR